MPQRFLRPGITTSDCWNACGWKAQSLYIRLITLVDDYGRYDGRIAIIHGHCFPLRIDITPQETAALVSELSSNGLVELYSVEGKDYLQMLKWHERTRGESRYPDPKTGQILRNPAESCGILPPEPLAISHKPTPASQRNPADSRELIIPHSLNSQQFLIVWSEWQTYRRKVKACKDWPTLFKKTLEKLEGYGLEGAILSLNESMSNGWQGTFDPKLKKVNGKKPAPIVTMSDPFPIEEAEIK